MGRVCGGGGGELESGSEGSVEQNAEEIEREDQEKGGRGGWGMTGRKEQELGEKGMGSLDTPVTPPPTKFLFTYLKVTLQQCGVNNLSSVHDVLLSFYIS